MYFFILSLPIFKAFQYNIKLLEKSAKSADDYMKLAREILNTINEYQGYSKEISNKCKLWASDLYNIAGDLIMDELGQSLNWAIKILKASILNEDAEKYREIFIFKKQRRQYIAKQVLRCPLKY